MSQPSIKEVEQDIRRGLRVIVDHIIFRDNKWQPYLEVKISIEEVRHLPIRVSAIDLFLSYNAEEIGPLPSLPRPHELTEPGEGVEIRMRKDLYPTLVEELLNRKRAEDFFQVRGMIIIESPNYLGFLEFPVDCTYVFR